VTRSPETWSNPRGWEAKVKYKPLITGWTCGCGHLSNSHPRGALVTASPSCCCLTSNSMGLARGAKQEEGEPDYGILRATSLWVGTRTCYGTVVRTDKPKRVDRLGPKGHGPWATDSLFRGMHSVVDPADSTTLK
jgi:hypothetical protein